MAEFSVTLSNGTGMLGGSPTSGNWGSLTWNAFLWGYTLDLGVEVGKGVANTQASTDFQGWNFGKWLAESQPTVVAISYDYTMVLSNECPVVGDMEHEYLFDAAGYYHVFPSNTTDGEGRDVPTWTAGTAGSVTWTPVATSATVWS